MKQLIQLTENTATSIPNTIQTIKICFFLFHSNYGFVAISDHKNEQR